jgi:hypothetical protein
MKHTNTAYGKNAGIFKVKEGGMCGNNYALKS